MWNELHSLSTITSNKNHLTNLPRSNSTDHTQKFTLKINANYITKRVGFVLTVRTCIALMTKKHMGISKYKETLTNSIGSASTENK